MAQQIKTKAQQALDALEQAWTYYTPEPPLVSTSPVYEEIPLAA